MQVSFGNIYRVKTPVEYRNTENKKQRRAVDSVLRNGRFASYYYTPKEQNAIRTFTKENAPDYYAPKRGVNMVGNTLGATSFSITNATYLCTGKDSRNVDKILQKLKKQGATTEEYSKTLEKYAKKASEEGKVGMLFYGSTDGVRYDIFEIRTPNKNSDTGEAEYISNNLFLGDI